ncbi:MAG: single-stranded DNA-binding protein [Bacteroidaceae bacterium]|nr:single-stranded DNA-binding protein [Bacteroidaceae bacterium]
MNKVILLGTVDKEPEVRYLDKGVCVANLTLMTVERGIELPDGTTTSDHNEWHRLVFWRSLATIVETQVHQGTRLMVEGKLHSRSYTDKSGVSRRITEVWADTLEIM